MAPNNNKPTVESGVIAPEEAAKIRASVQGKEQAPSSQNQALFSDWRAAADTLGSPFQIEHIPISKLRAMRRDPMLGFGLSFIKTPHVRAKWYINAKGPDGPNAQIAAHIDQDLRRIYPSFVMQFCNCIDFGFQAIAKRFQLRTPTGTYVSVNPDTGEETEEPIWSEGGVEPIGFKPFIALPPEYVNPIWNNNGEFDGIDYNTSEGTPPAGAPTDAAAVVHQIDLYHSLWVTNERDQNFGNIFGYPRLGYAFRYWWSYWFRWAIADRAFERKADPSVLVYHPEGEFVDADGATMSHAEYALLMGERMRSGGVIALPSETYEDINGRGTTRQWEIEFTKDAVNFEPFDKSFDYLDVQKLRSLWIPEQAFLEGKGGTSSRNVAAEMGESFVESQAVFASQIVETINRYLIPQFIAVNYPEFAEAGGTAEMVMQGFADQDVEFTKQIIQMIGQQETGSREISKLVDLKRVLEDAGMPISSFAEQQRREEEIVAEQAAAAGPAPGPVPGGGGLSVVPTATGFSYSEAPRDEMIILADPVGTEFIESLPPSAHYQDRAIKGFTRELFSLYRDLYRDEIRTAVSTIKQGADSDEEIAEFAMKDSLAKASRLIKDWQMSKKWPQTITRTKDIFQSVFKRASRVEASNAGLDNKFDTEDMDEYMKTHISDFAQKVAETTRTEVRDFLAKKIDEGVTDRAELAKAVLEHFDEFPTWKAQRVARTEIRDVYNAATLMAAKANNRQVQASDASAGTDAHTDDECKNRDGIILNWREALKEDEHPNGTLAWKILPVELSIRRSEEPMEEGAEFDKETNVLTLSSDLDEATERAILKTVVASLSP